jgi:hypothetical protein
MTTQTTPARNGLPMLLLALAALLAACGGGAASVPDGNGGDGSTSTDVAPTEDAGIVGSGNGSSDSAADLSKGRAKGSASGDVSFDFELGVLPPPVALYKSDADLTTYLVFANADSTELLYLTYDKSGSIIQYVRGGMGLTVGPGGCQTQMDELDDSHAKGSTTCKGMSVLEGDAAIRTADMTFTFDAHK